jgi:TetR/AcrR family transcriptional repressor of mexJK operon
VILEAATTLFLQNGYSGTSMDEIAALAGVSKQTVYTHFTDKERLFSELVLLNTHRVDAFIDTLAPLLGESHDLERDLRDLARGYITVVIQPEVIRLRRLVIAEGGRFPELARSYYERVPNRTLATLASHLQNLADRGLLQIEDAQLAAVHFAALILWLPLDRAMFRADVVPAKPAELERLADAAVKVFFAAYRK